MDHVQVQGIVIYFQYKVHSYTRLKLGQHLRVVYHILIEKQIHVWYEIQSMNKGWQLFYALNSIPIISFTCYDDCQLLCSKMKQKKERVTLLFYDCFTLSNRIPTQCLMCRKKIKTFYILWQINRVTDTVRGAGLCHQQTF